MTVLNKYVLHISPCNFKKLVKWENGISSTHDNITLTTDGSKKPQITENATICSTSCSGQQPKIYKMSALLTLWENNNPSQRAINAIGVSMPCPDSKVHVAHMGPTWGRQDPGGIHIGPMNLAIRDGVVMASFSAHIIRGHVLNAFKANMLQFNPFYTW